MDWDLRQKQTYCMLTVSYGYVLTETKKLFFNPSLVLRVTIKRYSGTKKTVTCDGKNV